MNPIKIIHLADIHFSPENKEKALASLQVACEKATEQKIDLWTLAGDLFERAIQNTTNSGLPDLQRMIQKMMNIAPIVAVEGTLTHDIMGCYEVLQETNADHGFTLLDPHHAYYLINHEVFSDQEEFPDRANREADLLILGCPEPSKEWFLKDKRMGREEANRAIVDGMRNILLGMGAIRKEHPDIPCLFVYHGMVQGATMCSGQLVRQGEIAIGRDDLTLVGADYYALGHIHMAQQIGDLPAYFAGSVHPWTWGEMDQKSFNLVQIVDTTQVEGPQEPYSAQFRPVIDRIPFPHPPRKKIIVEEKPSSVGPVGDHSMREFAGYQAWLVVRGTKEILQQIDADELLLTLTGRHGALPGSRVTTDLIPTETVRAGEIRKAKGLQEKLKINAENSGRPIPGNVLEKADELEQAAKRSGDFWEGMHLRTNRLILRGAIGIDKGQGKDEIDVNLDDYNPGLIALSGPNGAGKSTIFKNMQPYSGPLTGKGKLQDHFRLRDSYRDYYFTDDRTGIPYRAFIQIDGQNETGKCEYHLYKDGKPLTTGREKDYTEKIIEIFGSKALFLRGTLVTQKPSKGNPELSDATKGEKKAIFRELGGLDYLQMHSESSKEKAKSAASMIERDKTKIDVLEPMIERLPEKEGELEKKEAELLNAASNLRSAEIDGANMKAKADKLKNCVDVHRKTKIEIEGISSQIEILRIEKDNLYRKNVEYNAVLSEAPGAKELLSEYDKLKEKETELNGKKTRILERREKLLGAYGNEKDIVLDAEKEINATKTEIAEKMAFCKQQKISRLKDIDRFQERLDEKIECPKCQYKFSIGQEEDKRNLGVAQVFVFDTDQAIIEYEKQIVCLNKKIADLVYPKEPDLPEFNEVIFASVCRILTQYNPDHYKAILEKSKEAGIRIEEGQKRIEQIDSSTKNFISEIEILEKNLDPDSEELYETALMSLESQKGVYIRCRENVKIIEANINALSSQIAELKTQKEKVENIRQAIKQNEQELIEWRYQEWAYGPDGIQALELDAMGPGIADVATRLLGVACEYNPWDREKRKGNPFNQIKFETTHIGGQGSKRKQIEDFLIFAHDVRDDTWTEISNISGGESVWVIRAIYDAFGIVRDQNTGRRFLTTFQDEKDGALDPEARLAYFKMLEAGHQESGRHQTIVITHSESAQEMIGQKIEL